MKKTVLFAALAASAMLYSCSRELTTIDQELNPVGEQITLTARLEGCSEEESRTELHYEGNSAVALWQNADKITLISNGGAKADFSLTSGAGTTEATFSGSLNSTALPFFAVYPSSLGAGKGSGKINFSLPQTQTGSVTAANGMMPSVAYIPNPEEGINFMNIGGLFRMKLTAPDAPVTVGKLEIYDLAGNMLWGDAHLNANSTLADPSTWVWTLENGDNKLIVDFSNNLKTLGTGVTTFYCAVPPGALSGGVRVIIYNQDGVAVDELCTGKDLTVQRAHIKPMKTTKVGEYTLLDLNGGANCYITDRSNTSVTYKFCASKGDGSPVSGISTAEDLWETQNGSASFNGGNVGYLIQNVAYGNGCITFNVLNRTGNAIIAARDSDNNIIWSWHIWMPYNAAVGSATLSGGTVMMDRNLGSISSMMGTSYTSTQVAFTYQWGRKDPFIMPYHTGNYSTLMSTSPAGIFTDELNMSADIDWSIKNPTVYIGISSGGKWDQNNIADWDGDTKSAYDPCPPGWRVPSSAQIGELSLGGWDATTFSRTDSYSNLIFPATGRRYLSSAGAFVIEKAENSVHYWTRTHGTNQATELVFSSTADPKTATTNKCMAHAVRCVADI